MPAGSSNYSWSVTNGTITGGGTSSTVTFTAGASGSVGLQVTYTDSTGCVKVSTLSIPIDIPAKPTIAPGGATIFCAGNNVPLSSSAASGNQWYLNNVPIALATNQTYNATATGNYTVQYVDANGCLSPMSVPVGVTVNPLPPTPAITISNVQNVNVSGSGTFTLNFNGAATPPLSTGATAAAVQAALNALPTIGGVGGSVGVSQAGLVYTVTFGGTLTGPQPEMSSTASAGVTAAVTAAPVCPSSPGNQASGPGALSYSWGITNGTITSATNVQTITYTAGASGDVILTLTVTDANSCSSPSAPADVPVRAPAPTPTITPGGPTTFAYPGSVTLTSSAATTYQWYVGGTPINTATNQSYVASTAGNYTVVVTDAFGCTSAPSAITTVTVNQATPVVTATGGTFTYDGNPHAGTGSATGGASETLTYTLSYSGTGSTTYGPTATAPTLAGTYNVVAHTDGDANNAAGDSAPAALTINKANPNIIATGGTFTYDGNPKAGSGTATGGAGESLTVTLTYNGTGSTTYGPSATAPSLAGTYTVTAHTNGDANNNAVDSSATALTINKFTSLVSATGGTFTYDGNAHAGTGSATGGAGETLTATLTYSGTGTTTYGPSATAPALAGTYNVVAHTDGDSNNAAGDSAPAALTINKANPVVNATGGTFPYDGNSKAGSGTATGGAGESLTVTLTYNGTGSTTYGPSATAPSLAGTYTVTAHTNGDANNNAADSTAAALTINKSNPLMSATGGTFTYNGSPEAGSGQAIGGAGESLPVTLSYLGVSGTTYGPTATPPTNAGAYQVTAHTVGDANNNPADSAPSALQINKATATINVTAYCVDFDGGPHTATGTATGVLSEALTGLDLTGTTHTAAGTYAGDAWSFTNANYSDASGTAGDSIVNAAITVPSSASSGSVNNVASVADAGTGATYAWSITNGTITGGTGTNSITFTAGAVGTLTLQVTVTTSTSCASTKSANVAVGVPAVTVTSVSPTSGSINGHTAVTVNGTGFASGATVTFGGNAATSVVVVNATQITASTPPHAAGTVNVTVTNTDTSAGTLTNGYTYTELFDANGDHVIDPSDIFYLIGYLFMHGPAPVGGTSAGDANGDGVIDPADIFYLVNYLFLGGPKPYAEPVAQTTSITAPMKGTISLGQPVLRGNRYVIPVTVDGGVLRHVFAFALRRGRGGSHHPSRDGPAAGIRGCTSR